MASIQAHRGPDDTGVWSDAEAGIAFAFRRLSILDLSPAGHQPMRSPSGRFVGMFNGEVYNHEELRASLRSAGFRFRGHSDTEVILAAVEHWGLRAAVERFVGMFAIAIWDGSERRLTLIRDRLGIKPLYVHRSAGVVGFSSELKGLVPCPGFTRALDRDALADYLRYLYVPAPRSIYASASKLPPGHLLEITDGDAPLPAPEPYWSVAEQADRGEAEPFNGSAAEATDALEALLRDAVGLRMIADVPVGALLSGGVDSSTVVAMMQAGSDRPVRTYTVGFDVAEYDEAKQAGAVAKALCTDHTELRVGADDALALVPDMARTFDEPIADPSLLPTYLICKLARKDVTVALTGDGGDEVFAGYNRYVYGRWTIGAVRRLPPSLRGMLRRGLDGAGSQAAPLRSWRGRAAKLASLLGAGTSGEMYRSLHSAWLAPRDLIPDAIDRRDLLVSAVDADRPGDLVSRMQLADQAVYLPDDLLAKVDRASMAVSLEARVPLLDHRVVEFAWRLPQRLKVRGRRGKWLLRQVLYRYVSPELVDRPKMGFTVPIEPWLRGPLREWGSDLLGSRALSDLAFIDGNAARRAWSAFQEGKGYRGLALWALLVFLAWQAHWSSD
jgi:asparagine synthase (glutamine-hydrolysing)